MSVITQEKIKLVGFSEFANCSFLEIRNSISMHPTATVVGEIPNYVNKQKIYSKIQNQKIILKCSSSRNTYINLFAGYINELEILNEGSDYYKVKIKLITASSKLAHKKYYRSYQDVSKTYGDIIKKVASQIQNVNIECNLESDKSIEMPVIQYSETNWDFIKRMASNCNASVIVDETKEILKIIIGKGNSTVKGTIKSSEYVYGIADRYYKKKGFDNGLNKSDFKYIEVKSKSVYDIYDIVIFNNEKYYICGKKAALINSEIIYTYILGNKSFFYEKQYNNKRFAGCTILGDVVSTQNETLKLKLHLKHDEDSSSKYDYKWVPESGNMMYCMPKKGTTVSLYFYNESETSAVAINCIRTNGNDSKLFAKNDKIFTTENDKGFKLSDDTMNFASEKEGEKLSLLELIDLRGIEASSKKKIILSAKETIGIEAKNVKFQTKGELFFLQAKDMSNVSAFISIYNTFQINGKKVYFEFTVFSSYPTINDEPTEKEFDWGKWWLNLVVEVTAVVAITVALTAITVATAGTGAVAAGVFIGGLAAGGFAVYDIQKTDLDNGEVRDTDKALILVAEQTFVGCITGAITGPGVGNIAQKIAIEMGCEGVSTIAKNVTKNLLDGKDWNANMYDNVVTNMLCAGIFKGFGEAKLGGRLAKKAGEASEKLATKSKAYRGLYEGFKNSKLTKGFKSFYKGYNETKVKNLGKEWTEAMEKSNNKLIQGSDLVKNAEKKVVDTEEKLAQNEAKIAARNTEKDILDNSLKDARKAAKNAPKGYPKSQAKLNVQNLEKGLKSKNDSINGLNKTRKGLVRNNERAITNKKVAESQVEKQVTKKNVQNTTRAINELVKLPSTYKNLGKKELQKEEKKIMKDNAHSAVDALTNKPKKDNKLLSDSQKQHYADLENGVNNYNQRYNNTNAYENNNKISVKLDSTSKNNITTDHKKTATITTDQKNTIINTNH